MAVSWLPMVWPNTCPTLEAGSVLTSSTRLPASASVMALAQDSEVLPTPPLLVKNKRTGGLSRNCIETSSTVGLAAGGIPTTTAFWCDTNFFQRQAIPARQILTSRITTGHNKFSVQ